MATQTINFNDTPYLKDYTRLQGDTISEPWHLKIKSEDATTYSDLSLSGCTIAMTVKKDNIAVITSRAITADTASQGKFTMLITATDTAAWEGEYRYEIQVVFSAGHTNFPSGATCTVLSGIIKIKSDLA